MHAASASPVVVAVTVRDGRVLMVRHKTSRGALSPWVFPGGKVNADESEEGAVVREVLEETGFNCLPLRRIGSRVHPVSKQQLTYWACAFRGGKAVKERDVISDVAWVDIDDIGRLVPDQLFQGVKTFLQQSKLQAPG